MRDFQDPKKLPPKPASRPDGLNWLTRLRLFRRDMFSSQPERLYSAKMAQVRTPFFNSFLINTPDDVQRVLSAPNDQFPKSSIVSAGLRDLLGNSVFVANGAQWESARRMIDPVFEGGKIKASFPAIIAAGEDTIVRLSTCVGPIDIETEASRLAADVMFRVIFSKPIGDQDAEQVFAAFQTYQRSQPLWNLADILRLPAWIPRFRSRHAKQAAAQIRKLLGTLIDQRYRMQQPWPNDLLTGLFEAVDGNKKKPFTRNELIDQVAIFFLAGHETSASALSWALYLIASHPEAQDRIAAEARLFDNSFACLSKLSFTRKVFRETLRLYPPVPMMLRDAGKPWTVRGRDVAKGSLVILSPWHLGRHKSLWEKPDAFDPDRWNDAVPKFASIPFSAGPRVCVGAGFAMAEGVTFLAQIMRAFEVHPMSGTDPVPVAHLTLRSKKGIFLHLSPRRSLANNG